ncbi:Transmembrane protein 19 [Gracilariopsis chorda]|uniref:Transmembrane protein 19 n=1 Tax=Gracilariopsis chorda TaxID=448386 RepID=A0A2V3IT35_9FLOR|nr:Transmembrane protein 19 [Gracilariopsis chorda]|eukprot:PXF44897.1 Transmembrane protein 19 [Gracilariopsis chorda]
MSQRERIFLGLLIASLLALRGHQRKSLSPTGALAAFLVGFLSFASSVRFGLTLLSFYISATRATRYKADYKRRVEDGYTAEHGNRSAFQVLASSLPASIIAVVYALWFGLDRAVNAEEPVASALLLAYLLFFAACAGDTFSSEIGIAMPGPGKLPILITAPWRKVPRGTNGGVTIEGTMASAVGGLFVGVTFFVSGPVYDWSQAWLIVVGVVGGVVGSGLDSIVGAIAQSSWLDKRTGKVVKEVGAVNKDRDGYEHICGRNWLGGESVNAVAAIATSACAPLLVSMLYG